MTLKGTETRTNEVTAIAWCTLSSTAYNVLMVRETVYNLKANFKSLNLPKFKHVNSMNSICFVFFVVENL